MKNLDTHFDNQLRTHQSNELDRICEEMEQELQRLGYSSRHINKIEDYIADQAQQCKISLERDFEPMQPHEWIADKHEAGEIEETLAWSRPCG